MPAPELTDTPTLLVAWFCPFAQRTLIAATAKKLGGGASSAAAPPFNVHEVSSDELYGKPQWFLDLNPAGLIPVIAWRQQQQQQDEAGRLVSITESLICNEFVEEAFPGPPLLPADPAARAAARLLIHRFSEKFVPAFYRLLVRQQPDEQAAAAAALDRELGWLMGSVRGPLALGGDLSLVDCAVAPFLLRLDILEHYRGYDPAPRLGAAAAARLRGYLEAAAAHPAVAATRHHPGGLDYRQALVESYARYADGSADSQMARDARAAAARQQQQQQQGEQQREREQ